MAYGYRELWIALTMLAACAALETSAVTDEASVGSTTRTAAMMEWLLYGGGG
jgi:hypothetical protein